MDWAVDLIASVDKEDLRIIRETLEAKHKAEHGQYGEAARILWELLIQVRRAKLRQWECMTMIHMGKVYRALRWSIAVQLFEEVLELAEPLRFHQAKIMALVELGEMRCQWGQFEESLDLFAQAMSLLETDDLATKRIILLNQVIAYEGLDDLGRCERLLGDVIAIDQAISCDEIEDDLAHLERIKTNNGSG